MSSIGGLSGSTSNSIRGYGGLASGLDRDTLIENMTYGTTSKITQQEQKKTQLQWKMDAVRSISDKMIDFANKYTATMTSSTNLFNSLFWGKSNVSVQGQFSNFVKASGMSNTANDIAIQGVRQLARKASWTSEAATNTKISASADPTQDVDVSKLSGQDINFKYGGKLYSIYLPFDGDYKTLEDAAKGIEEQLKAEAVPGGEKLSDIVKVGVSADGKRLEFSAAKGDKEGNELLLMGGEALKTLGFDDPGEDGVSFSGTNVVSSARDITADDLIEKLDFFEAVAGKSMTFRYNGKNAEITLPSDTELTGTDAEKMEQIRSSIQDQLNKEFGSGRVAVQLNGNDLSFETTTPDGSSDPTSVLSVAYGDKTLMSAFGLKSGVSNRINLEEKIADNASLGISVGDKFKINGTEITVEAKDTISSLMDKINEESSVKVAYQEASGKFIFTAKEDGASGRIEFEAADSGNDISSSIKDLFNLQDTGYKAGQDAIVAVKYGDSSDPVEIVRGSNTFDIDGLTVTVSGKFGYQDGATSVDGLDLASEAVTFDAKVDADKIVTNIKEMITAYNEIVDLVNKEVSTKPDRSYSPLTSEQKKELDEDEIKLYEEKAKQGILFGDSDLRQLSNDLWMVIGASDQEALREIGISTSSSYSDNGKIEFDEAKFRAALESDPDKVQELFTKQSTTDENGNVIGVNGIAANMKNVMYKYANNIGTYGTLITKAGSAKAPRSITDNSIYKEMEDINKKISDLQTRLKNERDRYIKQFTSLESLISQMNSQSSWLSQVGGSF